jgi:hypothetical protein
MKGFKIEINNQKISAAVKKGVVLIILDNAEKITISGVDNEKFQNLLWIREKLNIGDRIKIIASDIERLSDPNSKELIDRQKLLVEYTELKKALTEEGLLR